MYRHYQLLAAEVTQWPCLTFNVKETNEVCLIVKLGLVMTASRVPLLVSCAEMVIYTLMIGQDLLLLRIVYYEGNAAFEWASRTWTCHWTLQLSFRSFETGRLSNNMKSSSPECYVTFWNMTMYNDTINLSDISSTLCNPPLLIVTWHSG